MFATIFIGILDPKSGRLSYINGGNDPALIVGKDGKAHTRLTARDLPLVLFLKLNSLLKKLPSPTMT